jgi:iron complex transport system ATP-binding protein
MSLSLQTRDLSVQVGATHLLSGIDLDVPAGRWAAIVGPNGAGKSTLLKAVAGLLPCRGDVSWQGRVLSNWPAKQKARALAWLGQTESGADDLRAMDVVMLGRLPHQAWLAAPSSLDREAVQWAMARTHCWDWRERVLGQLSGGERQRVLLARALAVQAQVVLMDEPLSHLDPPHQADWLDIVRDLRDQGVTVISVLHELNVALQADTLVVVQAGCLKHQGPTQDAASHQALVDVFEGRIALHEVAGQWVALPCTRQGVFVGQERSR